MKMKKNPLIIVEDLDVKINYERLKKRVMGSKKEPDALTLKELDECLKNCNPKPKGIYSFFSYFYDNDRIILENHKIESKFIAKRFRENYQKSNELGLFIVTIGSSTEDLARDAIKEKDPLNAWFYTHIGSEFAEVSADALHRLIEKEKGYAMHRYSPGYNDWQISEQEKLFNLVPGKNIGVTLQKSHLMLPEKSISAIIGYSNGKSNKECKGCKDCTNRNNCEYRNS